MPQVGVDSLVSLLAEGHVPLHDLGGRSIVAEDAVALSLGVDQRDGLSLELLA